MMGCFVNGSGVFDDEPKLPLIGSILTLTRNLIPKRFKRHGH